MVASSAGVESVRMKRLQELFAGAWRRHLMEEAAKEQAQREAS